MENPELLKYLATLGVGGVLAGVIFFFYRSDAMQHAKAWQGQSEMLIQVVKENTSAVTGLQQMTAALQGTIASLQTDLQERELWWREHLPRAKE